MARKHNLFLLAALALVSILSAGCYGRLDSSVATFNASATQIAGGGGVVGTPLAMLTPEPTPAPNLFDLTTDPTATLVHAWGETYGLASGSEFTIIASQQQVSDFVIETLQIGGWQNTVKGGNVTIGSGQIRLDVALIDTTGAAGSGTVTFQPTLDEMSRLKLNPQGAQFGSLQLPNGLTEALGDAITTALLGARTDAKVTLTSLSLENQVMKISGKVR